VSAHVSAATVHGISPATLVQCCWGMCRQYGTTTEGIIVLSVLSKESLDKVRELYEHYMQHL